MLQPPNDEDSLPKIIKVVEISKTIFENFCIHGIVLVEGEGNLMKFSQIFYALLEKLKNFVWGKQQEETTNCLLKYYVVLVMFEGRFGGSLFLEFFLRNVLLKVLNLKSDDIGN